MTNLERRSEFALIGLIIFVGVTPFLEGLFRLIGYLMLIILLVSREKIRRYEPSVLALTFFFVIFGLVHDIFSPHGLSTVALGTHLLFLAGLSTGWVAASRIPFERMAQSLAKWAVIFSVLSFFGVLLYTFFPGAVSSLPTYGYHHTVHHSLGIFNILVDPEGSVVERNSGIASEPGLFQLVLNLGAAALLKTPREKMSLSWGFQLAVIGFAIVATRSTMGIAIFAIILVVGAFRSGKIILGIGVFLILGWEALRAEITYHQENKLSGSDSFEARLMPMIQVVSDTPSHPFGVGNTEYNFYFEEKNWGAFDSLSSILIRYGLPLAMLLVALLVRNFTKCPLFKLAIILTMASQPIWFIPLVSYFYYSDFQDSNATPSHYPTAIESSSKVEN